MVKTIEVFANTGHHYHFVPLPRQAYKDNVRLATDWPSAMSAGWKQLGEHAWVRYRAGMHYVEGKQTEGIWLAIESNLGKRTRGMVYAPGRPTSPRPLAESGHDREWRYRFSSLHDA